MKHSGFPVCVDSIVGRLILFPPTVYYSLQPLMERLSKLRIIRLLDQPFKVGKCRDWESSRNRTELTPPLENSR